MIKIPYGICNITLNFTIKYIYKKYCHKYIYWFSIIIYNCLSVYKMNLI